jgi:cation diffusion facilitator CzcD-associated flavoprotein CzcO
MYGENPPDVVIIGAGPSGLVLALALAHYKINVRLMLIARIEELLIKMIVSRS